MIMDTMMGLVLVMNTEALDGKGRFVCVKICVGNITDLSKGIICRAVVESVISVAIYDSLILGGIGRDWGGTWETRGFCYPGVDDGRIECDIFVLDCN